MDLKVRVSGYSVTRFLCCKVQLNLKLILLFSRWCVLSMVVDVPDDSYRWLARHVRLLLARIEKLEKASKEFCWNVRAPEFVPAKVSSEPSRAEGAQSVVD